MSGVIRPLSQYAFVECCSVKNKHMDNFTFTLLIMNLNRPEGRRISRKKDEYPMKVQPYSLVCS
jgi:hypothetical protein